MANRPEYDLAAVVRLAIERRLASVHTHLVARVVSYDASKQRVSVQPEIQDNTYDESGTRTAVDLPTISDVPVAFPRAGGFRVTFPIRPGDRVLLCVSEQALERWKATGGRTDPGPGARRFHLTDAIAIPGVADASASLASAPIDRMSAGSDTGPTIEFNPADVRLGAQTALDAVIKGTQFTTALAVFLTGLDVFVAAVSAYATAIKPVADPSNVGTSTIVSACTAMATVTTTFAGQLASFLSLLVKVA